jgi:hypothetical protein
MNLFFRCEKDFFSSFITNTPMCVCVCVCVSLASEKLIDTLFVLFENDATNTDLFEHFFHRSFQQRIGMIGIEFL